MLRHRLPEFGGILGRQVLAEEQLGQLKA